MKPAPLTKISIATSPEAEEAVAELLLRCLGQTPSTYFDAETGETTVSTYLERPTQWNAAARTELQAGLRILAECGLDTGPGEISASRVRREDWAESWKRHFKPLEIGDALLIKPSWEKRKARKGQAVVILDPGLSFGTGHHATTGFCLKQLVAVRSSFNSAAPVGRDSVEPHSERSEVSAASVSPKMLATLAPTASANRARRSLALPGRTLSFLDIGTGSGI
ncbi:MAG: 50S ribosomal protein L11 methyltransferase, partial [Limisphaerales bacterium]